MSSKSFLWLIFLLAGLTSCKINQSILPYTYALLSAHVYQDTERPLPEQVTTYLEHNEGSSFAGVLSNFIGSVDLDLVQKLKEEDENGKLIGYLAMKAVTSGGYYGQAFLADNDQMLIIAHRGTDSRMQQMLGEKKISAGGGKELLALIRDLDDDYEIYAGKIPGDQFILARKFATKAKEAYRDKFKRAPKVVHTGHSLGAVLAELCAIADDEEAITFESPGTLPMLAQLEDYVEDFDYEAFNSKNTKVIIYNAAPNEINTLHPQTGKVIVLDRTASGRSGKKDFLSNNLQYHSIDYLLTQFDPRTGYPK